MQQFGQGFPQGGKLPDGWRRRADDPENRVIAGRLHELPFAVIENGHEELGRHTRIEEIAVLRGFAWGGGDSDYFGFGSTKGTDLSLSGYTVGGGAEYMLSDHVSVKAEYLYIDLNEEDLKTQFSGFKGAGVEANVVRMGVNYNFGMP